MWRRLSRVLWWPLVASVALASPEAIAGAHAPTIGAAEAVVGQVYGNSVLRRLKANEDIFANQRVRTGVDSAAALRFLDRTRLSLGPQAEVVLDKLVYDPDANAAQGAINVLRGVLRFASSVSKPDVTINAPGAAIGIRGTVVDVWVSGGTTEIVVREGRVEVDTPHGPVSVGPNEALTVSRAGISRSRQGSPRMQAAVAEMLALAGDASEPAAAHADTPGQAALQNWRDAKPQNLLYLDLVYGRVIIELRPDLAPRHVARIKELVRAGFYDGLAFHSVTPGGFALTGDPTGTGHGGSGAPLAAEFSNETFRRGSVGMAYERGRPDTADSQFFIALEDFPQLDGKYTLWGQVVHGLEHVERLRVGSPPANPDTIVRMRIAADAGG